MNLSNITYADPGYTLVFIAVSQNGSMFSFVNQLNNRFDIWWERWGRWRAEMQPLTFHAFLVKGYNTKSDSGMGFKAVEHLCEFINIHEAKVFNAAYLLEYNKIYATAGPEETIELVVLFCEKLQQLQQERHTWIDFAEKAAARVFQDDIASVLFGKAVPIEVFQHEIDTGFCADMFNWEEVNGESATESDFSINKQ